MGLLWDSKKEKEEKARLAKIKAEAELSSFLALTEKEKFTLIFKELQRIDAVNKRQDSDINYAETVGTIGLFT